MPERLAVQGEGIGYIKKAANEVPFHGAGKRN